MNILIVEDEILIAKSIKKILMKDSHTNIVEISTNSKDAFEKVTTHIFDIVIVDIFLGEEKITGLDLCKKIKKLKAQTPIIMITSSTSIQYLEKAFEIGINDYITKPFNQKELLIRIKRWYKLCQKFSIKNKIHYKSFTYDFDTNQFYYNKKLISLTKKTKTLFLLFLKHPEQLLSKQYLKEKIWGDYANIDKRRNLRSNIQSLRKALLAKHADWIKTIRGEGYILKK